MRTLPLSAALVVCGLLGLAVAFYGNWSGLGGRSFAVSLAVLMTLLTGQILLASAGLVERAAERLGKAGAVGCVFVPLSVYAAYAAGTGTTTAGWMLAIAAYTLTPSLLLASVRGQRAGTWADYAAALTLWLPMEFRWLGGAWAASGEFRYPLSTLLAVNTTLASFLLLRRLDGVGYSLGWGPRWGRVIFGHFALFAALAIPLGLAVDFLAWRPNPERLSLLPVTLVATLLFTAWPEELLFRGLLQNFFEKSLRGPWAGLVAGAVVFGLSHINNLGFPNWRYVLLATLAGLFYGRVWQKTGSLFASAMVHTLVNTVWGLLFRTA